MKSTILLRAAFLLLALSTHADEFTLFGGTAPATVVYAADGGTPIAKVAALLGHDLRGLTGKDPLVTSNFDVGDGTAVIIGRADSSSIAAILRGNQIST